MNGFLTWIDRTPVWLFAVLAATLGLAPFVPEPHIAEKIRWLLQGELRNVIDWFDLAFHGIPWLLLALKLTRETRAEWQSRRNAPGQLPRGD
jgi:hypothetical protein